MLRTMQRSTRTPNKHPTSNKHKKPARQPRPALVWRPGARLPNVEGLTLAQKQVAWVKAAQRGSEKAALLAVDSLNGLVYKLVRKWLGGVSRGQIVDEDVEDLVAEVRIALLTVAMPSYNPKKAAWVTHSVWMIRCVCSRWVKDHASTIRVPVHQREAWVKVQKAYAAYLRDHGVSPDDLALARAAGMSTKQLRNAREGEVLRSTQSLDARVGDEGFATVGDLTMDHAPGPEAVFAFGELSHKLRRALDVLTEREREVIERRFGLCEEAYETLAEIGETHELSRERVRQVQLIAMAKLRKECLRRKLGGPEID